VDVNNTKLQGKKNSKIELQFYFIK